MPFYNKSAFATGTGITRLTTGLLPIYLFGYFDTHTIPFQFQISNIAVTSNLVTATGNIVSGGGGANAITGLPALPTVNAIMGVRGTHTSNGNLNTDPTIVVGTNISNTTGAGYIQYYTSINTPNANSFTVDSGTIIVQPYEYPDVLQVGASAPVAAAFTPDESNNDRSLQIQVAFPSSPKNCNVVLQCASYDNNASYSNVENSQGSYIAGQVIGNVVTQTSAQYQFIMSKFYRAYVTDFTANTSGSNTTPNIVCTIFA